MTKMQNYRHKRLRRVSREGSHKRTQNRGNTYKKNVAEVTQDTPPPPYPGRATPAHPPSSFSAKAVCGVSTFLYINAVKDKTLFFFCSHAGSADIYIYIYIYVYIYIYIHISTCLRRTRHRAWFEQRTHTGDVYMRSLCNRGSG